MITQGFVFNSEKLDFDPNKPYTVCLLCGKLFQGQLDLRVPEGHEPETSLIARLAKLKRDEWAISHARKEHTAHEHKMHLLSGRFATPEAAQELAARGIFSIADLVLDAEVAEALSTAPTTPIYEAEGA